MRKRIWESKYFISFLLWLMLFGSSFGKEFAYDAFPYVFYDSSIGYSYGLFGCTKNLFNKDELLTFYYNYDGNGGRETALFAELPGKRQRHKTLYPFALDIEFLIGKKIEDRFYGFGSASPSINYSTFDWEYNELRLCFSRAFSSNLALESSLQFNSSILSNISQGSYPVTQDMIDITKQYYIGGFGIKIDNTNDLLYPKSGENLSANLDFGLKGAGSNADFARFKLDFRKFFTPFNPDQVLAGRIVLTEVSGPSIPLYEYAALGGKYNLRGYYRYRFRGNGSILLNLEYRFPIIWKLGGVVFMDSGKVFASQEEIDFDNIATNFGIGLRLYLTNLILRFDYGKGSEGGSYYFYYNQLF